MRMRLLLPALVLLASSAPAFAVDEKPLRFDVDAAKAGREPPPLTEEIRDAFERIDADRNDAERRLNAVIDAPEFGALPASPRSLVLATAGWLASMRGDPDGDTLLSRAAALDSRIWTLWVELAHRATAEKRDAEAARTLAVVARRWPEQLPDVEAWLVHAIANADSRESGDSVDRRLLREALAAADYAPRTTGDAGWLWFALAHDRLARGDTDGARAAVRRVETPAELAKLRADRRFDALLDRDASGSDVVLAARARVEDLRARALLRPEVLETQSALAAAMLVVGDAASVLALVDDVEAAYAAEGEPGYVDDDQRVWMLNHRANALRMLGRGDEAAAVLERARRMDESGAANVSQVLNLGELYCANGEPAKTTALLADVGRMNDYGRMVKAWVEICAAQALGDEANVEKELAWIREHREHSEGILTDALLIAGRADEAAAVVVERLRDPRLRTQMLLDLQTFAETPALPGERALREAARALEARDDVRSALEAVGRRESYTIHSP